MDLIYEIKNLCKIRKIIKVASVAVVAAVAGIGVYTSQKTEVTSDIVLANVEALARGEQPDVKDCIPATSQCCGLNPTDPSKDQIRYNARW